MSWLFSQALVAEYSAGTCLDGELSAQLNVIPTPHKFWRNDKTMEFCDLSRFGLTLQLLTVDHGEALLTSYLAAFRARTSVSPIRGGKVLKAHEQVQAGCTQNELLARWIPTLCGWRTAQCSLFEDSEQFLETWPASGSMRNGVCYLQKMLVPGICAPESGYLVPTPTATDYKGGRSQAFRKDGTPTTSEFRHWCRVLHGLTYPIPMHMEAIMGWPIGWTALEPLEMDKFQQWQQQHSSCLEQGLSNEMAAQDSAKNEVLICR